MRMTKKLQILFAKHMACIKVGQVAPLTRKPVEKNILSIDSKLLSHFQTRLAIGRESDILIGPGLFWLTLVSHIIIT